ncbi:MAG: type II toxin-antitoxin system RelE/ParE family toxin [Chthoniobacterales bacterium]|nr:type II toxin-antitoxin system RelE/ParE family toxin [Chthoniobacterales bacterium]
MGYKIIFSPRAQRDLREIQYYISFDSPQRADRFGQRLLARTEILQFHPEIGRTVPVFANRKIREIILGNYRIIYRVDHLKKEIEIVHYWHAARGTPDVRY